MRPPEERAPISPSPGESPGDGAWEDYLDSFIAGAGRILVLGIGNPVRGDDGAGTRVAELVRRAARRSRPRIPCLSIPGGSAPENFTGVMRRFGPGKAILVDAVSAGLAPGAITLLEPAALGGITLSTHTMPMGILRDYLLGAGFSDQAVIGIQPAGIRLGEPMSTEVREASRAVARAILRSLR